MIEAAFFDLDGTVIDKEGQLYPGLEPVLAPQNRGFPMTFLTARGYPRYQEAVRENSALAVTNMPVALEMGGRIIDSDTGENIHHIPLSPEDQAAIFAYIREAELLRYVAFHPREPRTKTILWSPDQNEAVRLHAAYSQNADVVTGSQDFLFRAIGQSNPSLITCRLYPGASPEGLPEDVHRYVNGTSINFIPHGVDKGVALQMIADMRNFHLPNTLVAGNDDPDLPALRVRGVGYPIAVGEGITPEMKATLPSRTIYVPDQRNLGSVIRRIRL